MVFEEAKKIKNMLIRNIKFAFWKKRVPGEIRDHIDLEQEVGVSDATVRAYMTAKTRKEKGEIISELYRETIKELVKKYPTLKPYFPELEVSKYDVWSEIQDQQKYIETLWDTYKAAEAGEDWAIDLIRGEGYQTLEEFKKAIEEEEKKLREMITELETTATPAKKKRVKEKEAEKVRKELRITLQILENTIAEKLTLYVKNQLLQKGLKISEINKIVEKIVGEIKEFAKAVAEKRTTQRDAEKELIKRTEELIKAREEKPKLKYEDVLKRLELEYKAFLRERGVTNVREVIEYIHHDIESLAEEVARGRMEIEEAMRRVRMIPVPPIAIFKKAPAPSLPPEKPEEVKVERIRRPEDILKILSRDWKEIVTHGLKEYLESRHVVPLKTILREFERSAWQILHFRKPKTIREWFITGYNPTGRDVLSMLLHFGIESRKFKDWLEQIYREFRPRLERLSGRKLPDYEEFYDAFKEFILEYKLY